MDPKYLILCCWGQLNYVLFLTLRFLMVFGLHQLMGRSQLFPWRHLWPILLKYSSFPGNNSQYDQNRISLPILMYYRWDLQPKNKGWHKKGEMGMRRGKKIEEPSSGLIWQMQSRKQEAVPVVDRMVFFSFFANLCQIINSDQIKLSPGPKNLWVTHVEQRKDYFRQKKMDYLVAAWLQLIVWSPPNMHNMHQN